MLYDAYSFVFDAAVAYFGYSNVVNTKILFEYGYLSDGSLLSGLLGIGLF